MKETEELKGSNYERTESKDSNHEFLQYLGIFILIVIAVMNIENFYANISASSDQNDLPETGVLKKTELDFTRYSDDKRWSYLASLNINYKDHLIINERNRGLGNKETKSRVKLNYPESSSIENEILVWEIEIIKDRNLSDGNKTRNLEEEDVMEKQHCSLINSLNIVTNLTIINIKTLLDSGKMIKIVVLTSPKDVYSSELMKKELEDEYSFKVTKSQIDSNYEWVTNPLEKCLSVMYLFSSTEIKPDFLYGIAEVQISLKPNEIYHPTKYISKNSEEKELKPLLTTDISKLDQNEISLYVLFFNPTVLSFLTPTNFAYFTRYTFEEIIIIPLLIVCQSARTIVSGKSIIHKSDLKLSSYNLYSLRSPQLDENSLCFVSAPSNSTLHDEKESMAYLRSILKSPSSKSIYIILYFPYSQNSSMNFFNLLETFSSEHKLSQTIRLKLRITLTKAVIPHAAYESVYNHCPIRSVIVTSRHNVEFDSNFSQKIINNTVQRYHYLFANLDVEGKIVSANLGANERGKIRKGDMFEKYFQYVQIFKSDLLKTTIFWGLKKAEMEFYDSEASMTIIMLEQTKVEFSLINETLIKVKKRNLPQEELDQISAVRTYHPLSELPKNKLIPYAYSCLDNIVFRRSAPLIAERNLHQIWLNKNKISDVRLFLHETVKAANPGFQMYFWTLNNFTKENFPLTYTMSQRAIEFTKDSPKSFFTLAADLMRYELIYRYGGIYVDFKMEGKKSMDPWRKYEAFFIDCEIGKLRFGSPPAVGNGILGGGIIFTNGIPKVTGGFKIRETATDKDFFHNWGLGYHLLFPYPYDDPVNACGGVGKKFDADQKIFSFPQPKNKILEIGIPCKKYPEAYLISYTPLAKTWVKIKTEVNN